MKCCAIILSIFFLALNFLPCADEVASNSLESEQLAEGHQDLEHEDLCSPFCQCHCCQFHFINSLQDSSSNINPEISTGVLAYLDNLGEEISDSLIEPPCV